MDVSGNYNSDLTQDVYTLKNLNNIIIYDFLTSKLMSLTKFQQKCSDFSNQINQRKHMILLYWEGDTF